MARVLIVDDSKVMRRNLRYTLTEAGHEVVGEAENGNEGYNFYQAFLPDIVTMDITMPDVDGVEAVKLIISDFPDAKIIMVSALSQKHMVLNALTSGAKNYVVKPINPERLLLAIDQVLGYPTKQSSNTQRYIETGKESKLEQQATTEVEPKIVCEEKQEFKPIEPEANNPFEILLQDNKFHINLGKTFTEESINTLNTAIQGIILVHPLKVNINFSKNVFQDAMLNKIAVLIKVILVANGSVQVTAENEELVQIIREKKIEDLSNIIEFISK